MPTFNIWEPRWHDRSVLLARNRVGENNWVRFTKTPSMMGVYYVSGEDVRSCTSDSNGRIPCYAVPLDKLTRIEDGDE